MSGLAEVLDEAPMATRGRCERFELVQLVAEAIFYAQERVESFDIPRVAFATRRSAHTHKTLSMLVAPELALSGKWRARMFPITLLVAALDTGPSVQGFYYVCVYARFSTGLRTS